MLEPGFQLPALFRRFWRALFCASEAKAHTVKTNKKALKSAIVKPRWAPKHILSLLLPAGEMKGYGGWIDGCLGAATFRHKSRDKPFAAMLLCKSGKKGISVDFRCKDLSPAAQCASPCGVGSSMEVAFAHRGKSVSLPVPFWKPLDSLAAPTSK